MKLSSTAFLSIGLLVLLCTPALLASESVTSDDEHAGIPPPAEVVFEDPGSFAGAHFVETFQTDPLKEGRWVASKTDKYKVQAIAHSAGRTSAVKGDMGLAAVVPAKHYGVSTKFESAFVPGETDTVLQYEVKMEDGMECGGAYLKFISAETEFVPVDLNDKTPFSVMFGPDKCGGTNKVHFIFRFQNPVSKEWEEKHLKDAPEIKKDKATHLYTLVIRGGDDSFDILIDGQVVKSGSLLEDFDPPVNPEQEIDDPQDKKPSDWVDLEQIQDPEASKPDDWDEEAPTHIEDPHAEKPAGWLDDAPAEIADPSASQPEDWDEEEDGEWEAPTVPNPDCTTGPGCGEWKRPLIRNPDYKGKWIHPLIPNPDYIGPWSPRRIPNPHYFSDPHPSRSLSPLAGVAIEIWTMSGNLLFDNVWVGSSATQAREFAAKTFDVKSAAETALAEHAAAVAQEKQRLQAYEEGGVLGAVRYHAAPAIQLLSSNPLYAIGFGLVLLLLLVFVCCSGGGAESDTATDGITTGGGGAAAAAADGAGADGDDDGDDDGEDGDEEEDSSADADAEEANADADADADASAADSTGLRQRKKRTPKST